MIKFTLQNIFIFWAILMWMCKFEYCSPAWLQNRAKRRHFSCAFTELTKEAWCQHVDSFLCKWINSRSRATMGEFHKQACLSNAQSSLLLCFSLFCYLLLLILLLSEQFWHFAKIADYFSSTNLIIQLSFFLWVYVYVFGANYGLQSVFFGPWNI